MAMTRRRAIGSAGLAALGAAVRRTGLSGPMLDVNAQAAGGDPLVVVFARGGYDGLNMVIPYGDEGYYFGRRPKIGIPAPDDNRAARRAADLDGFFGLHPALADNGWKEQFEAGSLAVVHAMHMNDSTRSHFDAMAYMEQGAPGRKNVRYGWVGRHLQSTATGASSPFRAVGMGPILQASLRGPTMAVTLQSISDFVLMCRPNESARFAPALESLHAGDGWMDQQGQSTFAAVKMLAERIAGQTYVPANGADYSAAGTFGQYMRQLAQIIKADMGLEAACVDIGGWDTHANETDGGDPTAGTLATLLATLSAGITAFTTDLRPSFDPSDRAARGIVLVVMSEFGRRVNENGAMGTDHGHGNVMFLFGKGIFGGKVYTRDWPGLADDDLDRGDLAGTIEYRDVLAEILAVRMGNRSLDQVFPGWSCSYLGLARPLEGAPTPLPPQPTSSPTNSSTPEATGTPPVPAGHRLLLPWAGRGGPS